MTDGRTGQGYVAGQRLSPRIKGFLKDAADEARQDVEATAGERLRTVPEVSSFRYGWLVVMLGVVMLCATAVWQWRSKSSLQH